MDLDDIKLALVTVAPKLLSGSPNINECHHESEGGEDVRAIDIDSDVRLYMTTVTKGLGWRATEEVAVGIEVLASAEIDEETGIIDEEWELEDEVDPYDAVEEVLTLLFERRKAAALAEYREQKALLTLGHWDRQLASL